MKFTVTILCKGPATVDYTRELMRKVMSSDSSNNDNEFEKIKEAVDNNFLTEDLFSNDAVKEKLKTSPKSKVSLRNQNHRELSTNPFSLRVTPEFQSHVSKHLSKLLDKLIDDTKIVQRHKKPKVKKNFNSGIKLLSSSKGYLLSTENTKLIVTPRKIICKRGLNENDFRERAREVAVSPEWVLSQDETRYWAANTKGKIEIVKLDNDFNKMT